MQDNEKNRDSMILIHSIVIKLKLLCTAQVKAGETEEYSALIRSYNTINIKLYKYYIKQFRSSITFTYICNIVACCNKIPCIVSALAASMTTTPFRLWCRELLDFLQIA